MYILLHTCEEVQQVKMRNENRLPPPAREGGDKQTLTSNTLDKRLDILRKSREMKKAARPSLVSSDGDIFSMVRSAAGDDILYLSIDRSSLFAHQIRCQSLEAPRARASSTHTYTRDITKLGRGSAFPERDKDSEGRKWSTNTGQKSATAAAAHTQLLSSSSSWPSRQKQQRLDLGGGLL